MMKKLLSVLVPLVLFAQVEVDAVIRLPSWLGQGFYTPELNKLYIMDHYNGGDLSVLDCSTYALKAEIPIGVAGATTHFSWNSRRQKLYVTSNPFMDSTLVVDAVADSIVGSLKVYHEFHTDTYLSDIDARFKPSSDTLYEYECSADTVIRRMPVHSTCASWDSVGHKVYVGQGSLKKLYVYDYLADSCVKVIDVSAIEVRMPDACVFSRTHRRAYVSSFQGEPWDVNLGIVDTEHDTLLGVLPVVLSDDIHRFVAVDERDGKVYIASQCGSTERGDTMWVVDCATDSVLKKFQCVPRGMTNTCIRWVPWSNRIYLVNKYPNDSTTTSLVVIDCNTDSVIVPGMLLNHGYIRDIQLDPIRERIFVIGADSSTIYVLRDTGYAGINGATPTGPRPAPGLRSQMTSGGCEVSYSIASPGRVDLAVYDLMGREVRQLVAEAQSAGQHSAVWNSADRSGAAVARGVYFVRLETPGFSDVKKAVVAR